MKMKRWLMSVVFVLVTAALVVSLAAAEDGKLFRRNVSKTPEAETEKAAIYMMDFYVPAQASTGLVGPVDNYLLADEATRWLMNHAIMPNRWFRFISTISGCMRANLSMTLSAQRD